MVTAQTVPIPLVKRSTEGRNKSTLPFFEVVVDSTLETVVVLVLFAVGVLGEHSALVVLEGVARVAGETGTGLQIGCGAEGADKEAFGA